MKRMACVLALAAGTGIVLGTGVSPVLAEPAPATVSNGLKLNIVPPGTVTNDGPIKLNVNFRGGTIQSVELLVDGTRVFKKTVKLLESQGALNFSIPSDLLPEGDHDVAVVAYDVDGNTATSSVRMHVASHQQDSIAHFVYPKRDAQVNRVVPIEIKLDPGINNPYVTFLLDNDFMAIRNYGPYVYNWDSNKVANGPHTISVEIYDADSHALIKKLTIPVNVLNERGLTNLQSTTPVIKNHPIPVLSVANIIGAAITPDTVISENGSGLTRSAKPLNSYALRGHEPETDFLPASKAAVEPDTLIPAIDPKAADTLSNTSGIGTNDPRNSAFHGKTTMPFMANIIDLTGAPDQMMAGRASTGNGTLSRVKLYARRAGNIAARPRAEFGSSSEVNAAPIMVAHPMPVAKVIARPNHAARTFDVAFDNSKIAFDVPPRIENGLPLAPFRAIFEHSGGSVQWYDRSKTVRAVNSTREIEFKIGDKAAQVNNHRVNMEAKPYVDRGRAIVPLSFVKDAMNVKVTYDAKSGHLLIESKK